MILWECENNTSCMNLNTVKDAKKICNELGIEHHVLEYKKEFREHVINNFITCYQDCQTPNPCIECNKYMKFGLMYEKARELGCKYIATGHYAKTEYDERYGKIVLKKSNSLYKDQSYVLYALQDNIIENIIFPLGGFESKDQIRKIAEKYGFEIAHKPDSQDICFIPDGDYINFLNENNIDFKPGDIVYKNGEVLGKHEGLHKYTIGQRKGLGIAHKTPLYVIKLDKYKNNVIVGEKEDVYSDYTKVKEFNNILGLEIKNLEVKAKVRYLAKEANATINQLDNGEIKVEFEEPQKAITPGQSIVFYIDDVVLGGGKIEN